MALRRVIGRVAVGLLLAAGCKSNGGATPDGGASLCPVMDDLLSDFTLDNGLHPVDGRQGGWFTYADDSGVGTIDPPEGGAATPASDTGNPNCSGPGALHVISSGFDDWGSALAVDFRPRVNVDGGGTAKGTYDATKYRGIAFWARSVNPIPFVQVSIMDPYTIPESAIPMEDRCRYAAGMPDNCSPYLVKFGYGYMGEALTPVMEDFPKYINTQIDSTWRRFEILFADMKQDSTNPGRQAPGNMLAVSQITGMAIQVNTDHSTTPATPTNWELWLDDVSFVK